MKINNLYQTFWDIRNSSKNKNLKNILSSDKDLNQLLNMAKEWELDLINVEKWMDSEPYKLNYQTAMNFSNKLERIVERVEETFSTKLEGEINLCPSLMQYDGFARYDSGKHRVWFGVDHPDADENYLSALICHELSHVYRDHQPKVWGFLGKPLSQVSRREYLDNMSAFEHIVSEGLATLFSQLLYPEIPLHVHHYYDEREMQWCFDNIKNIENAIFAELGDTEQNIWKFYEEDIIAAGSPSRTQYFWAAYKIRQWLEDKLADHDGDYKKALIDSHGLPAEEFECFK